MHIAIQLIFALAAWRWGDWKHWRKYYPTILFLIIGDLMNNFINYNRPFWTFTPNAWEKWLYPNHTIISLGVELIGYPSLVLLYLGNYPDGGRKQVLYVCAWVLAAPGRRLRARALVAWAAPGRRLAARALV
ncbi:CBO0543 family protein [Gordoniibacillus kamchatkensis]|uniref:CBO0543 family protein n=1 Tax=Gordoniibacillus kamchatkensis TaxID=1590651 RepID=UPI0006964AA0|nr:CBO0543 family protein [Paenibacillus sp. VKM B-2647]